MNDVLKTLMALQELFAPDGTWTQCCYARRRDGAAVAIVAPEATCWCLMGGLARVAPLDDWARRVVCTAALGFESSDELVMWNDAQGRTHADVRARISNAITEREAVK